MTLSLRADSCGSVFFCASDVAFDHLTCVKLFEMHNPLCNLRLHTSILSYPKPSFCYYNATHL